MNSLENFINQILNFLELTEGDYFIYIKIILAVIGTLILVPLSLYFSTCSFIKDLRIAFGSLYWPIVSGEIIRSDFESDWGEDPVFKLDIEYTYMVNGYRYLSSNIPEYSIDHLFYNVEQFKEKYPIYSKVNVIYNPKNPKESCLEERCWLYPIFDYIIGLFATLTLPFLFVLFILYLSLLWFVILIAITIGILFKKEVIAAVKQRKS